MESDESKFNRFRSYGPQDKDRQIMLRVLNYGSSHKIQCDSV